MEVTKEALQKTKHLTIRQEKFLTETAIQIVGEYLPSIWAEKLCQQFQMDTSIVSKLPKLSSLQNKDTPTTCYFFFLFSFIKKLLKKWNIFKKNTPAEIPRPKEDYSIGFQHTSPAKKQKLSHNQRELQASAKGTKSILGFFGKTN